MDGENFGGGRQKNVLGGALIPCSVAPMTGFFRDGCCHQSGRYRQPYRVCRDDNDFLSFSKAAGNDLTTPRAEYGFPGLKPGDSWCLCAARWEQARRAGQHQMLFFQLQMQPVCLLWRWKILGRML